MKNRKEHYLYKNLYLIPGMEYTYIDKSGVMFDEKAKAFLQIRMSAIYPYPCVRPSETKIDISVHRALAMTFLECPGNPNDYQVDHLNEDKLDWRLSNLEWVTCSENNKRAKKSFWSRKLLVKDLVTDTIREFSNIRSCAEYFQTTASEVVNFLKNPKLSPWQRRYDIIFESHSWSSLNKADVGKIRRGLDREVVLVSKKDKSVKIYPSIKLAAAALGVGRVTIYNRLWGKRISNRTKALIEHDVFCLNEFQGNLKNAIRFSDEELLLNRKIKYPNQKVRVKDLRTGEVKIYNDLQEFSNSISMKKNSVLKQISKNNGICRFYQVEYLDVPSGRNA